MSLLFSKMHGAGNDFILTRDPNMAHYRNPHDIARLCDRHKGIGADGLIYLEKEEKERRIHMYYFNSDGSPADLCGNGLRCSASFAYRNGLSGGDKKMNFISGGNILSAQVMTDDAEWVRIQLMITEKFQKYELSSSETVYKGGVGVPHLIKVVPDAGKIDVKSEGKRLRFEERFRPAGANVDFLSFPQRSGPVLIRTYERGVEDETLACGTGCASAAVVLHQFFDFPEKLSLLCRGGDLLEIEIIKECNILKGVFLTGPAVTVFEGELSNSF